MNQLIVLCNRLATTFTVGLKRLLVVAAVLLAAGHAAQAAPDSSWTALAHGPCGVVDGKAYCLDLLSPYAKPRLLGQEVVRVHGGDSIVCGVTREGDGVCGDAETSGDAVRVARGVSQIAGVQRSGAWCASLLDHGALCGVTETFLDRAQPGAPPADLPDAQRYLAVLKNRTSCALSEKGVIWCWGASWGGLLGRGDSADPAPAPVAGGHRYKSIAGGDRVWCGLVEDGTVRCWGDGRSGLLGTAASLDRCEFDDGTKFECARTPKLMQLPGPASQIDATLGDLCALLADQRVACRGPSQEALVIEGLPRDIVEIGMGGSHGCARSAAGDLWCWFLMDRRPVARKVARP